MITELFCFFFILVPSYIEIGCFLFPKSGLRDVLANHKDDFDPAKVKKYVDECSELAFQKGYSHFALGLKGNCLSSEHAEKEYFVKKGTNPQNCKDGIGSKTSIDVYTFGESINNAVIVSQKLFVLHSTKLMIMIGNLSTEVFSRSANAKKCVFMF